MTYTAAGGAPPAAVMSVLAGAGAAVIAAVVVATLLRPSAVADPVQSPTVEADATVLDKEPVLS